MRCLVGDAKRLSAAQSDFGFPLPSKPPSKTVLPSVLVMAGIAAGLYLYMSDALTTLRADHVTDVAQRASFRAPDGSNLVLNADSAIAFQFSQHERRVILMRGEMLVDVTPDPTRPFVVEADGATVTALGTAFDVNMLESETRVAVIRHSVAVRLSDEHQVKSSRRTRALILLQPPELARPSCRLKSVTEWESGRLVFDEQPLPDVIETVGRYLPGKILVANRELRSKMVSGTLDMSDPDKALQSFAKAFDIKLLKLTPYLTILR